jgi:tetratricopeptide (TPR) repeat protein
MRKRTSRLWAERAVRALDVSFPYVEFDSWPRCDRLLPHARAVVPWIEMERIRHARAARLLNQTAFYLNERAQFAEAETLYRQASEIWRAALGEHHPDYALSLNNLAGLYRATGRYAEAEPLFREAVTVFRALGREHPSYRTVLMNYAINKHEGGLLLPEGDFRQELLELLTAEPPNDEGSGDPRQPDSDGR